MGRTNRGGRAPGVRVTRAGAGRVSSRPLSAIRRSQNRATAAEALNRAQTARTVGRRFGAAAGARATRAGAGAGDFGFSAARRPRPRRR